MIRIFFSEIDFNLLKDKKRSALFVWQKIFVVVVWLAKKLLETTCSRKYDHGSEYEDSYPSRSLLFAT